MTEEWKPVVYRGMAFAGYTVNGDNWSWLHEAM